MHVFGNKITWNLFDYSSLIFNRDNIAPTQWTSFEQLIIIIGLLIAPLVWETCIAAAAKTVMFTGQQFYVGRVISTNHTHILLLFLSLLRILLLLCLLLLIGSNRC
jgi:hypothetical protein